MSYTNLQWGNYQCRNHFFININIQGCGYMYFSVGKKYKCILWKENMSSWLSYESNSHNFCVKKKNHILYKQNHISKF